MDSNNHKFRGSGWTVELWLESWGGEAPTVSQKVEAKLQHLGWGAEAIRAILVTGEHKGTTFDQVARFWNCYDPYARA